MKGLGIVRIEHIGIATEHESAEEAFTKLLGDYPYKTELVESEKVRTSFYQPGETKIELLEDVEDGNTISKFVYKRGPGIHHIAFEVADIYHAFSQAQSMGFRVLNESPKIGADNKMIFFIHPKDTGGVLVECCQEIRE